MTVTSLHVKLPDGADSVKFTPALQPTQYAELQSLLEKTLNVAEVRRQIMELARSWDIQVEFDGT